MSAWLPKVVEPSKQQVLAAVFFLILYPYYLIRGFKKACFCSRGFAKEHSNQRHGTIQIGKKAICCEDKERQRVRARYSILDTA